MGAKPKETVPGDNCALCWDPGETPSELHVFFGGISMGQAWFAGLPLPPNGYYILIQNPILPCRYDLDTGDMIMSLVYVDGQSTLFVEAAGMWSVFDSLTLDNCTKYFPSDLVDGPMAGFFGGFGFISTMGDIIDKVNTMVPVYEDNARFEVTPGAGGTLNIRYANRKHRQNINVQVPAD